jgi:F0F1-type ATP synthase delta subunit
MKYTETIARSMRDKINKGFGIETVIAKTEEVLREHKQELFFIGALRRLSVLLERDMRFENLHIQSAFELPDSSIGKIAKTVTGSSETKSTFTLNTKLLAGFVATYKGRVYDGSARQYITKLGKQ